jgi:rod shape determining protein RodA
MAGRPYALHASSGSLPNLWVLVRRVPWFYVALLCTLACVGYFGLVAAGDGDASVYAVRHIQRFVIGLGITIGLAFVPLRIINMLAWPLYGVSLTLLGLVLRMGHVGKGAQRWLDVGGLELQPSELMKIALVLALASWFRHATWEKMARPLYLLPPLLAVLAPVVLILKEPNLGTAMIVLMLGVAMFLAAGLRWWVILLLGVVGIGGAPLAYAHLHDYQKARITTFLNPESDPLGAGYNILQSKIALGSGGFWGKGYLHGTQTMLNFLPEKQTDFIFTLLGEQFGYVGCLSLMAVLLLTAQAGIVMGIRCREPFARFLALGIACNFFLYCFVNIAMVMGAIPVGGVPLPLISHGGSAMFTVMGGFGLLLAAYMQRDKTV